MRGLLTYIPKAKFSVELPIYPVPEQLKDELDWDVHEIPEYNKSIYPPEIPIRRIEEQGRTFLNLGRQAFIDRQFKDSNKLLDKAFSIFKSNFGSYYPELFEVFLYKARNFRGVREYKLSKEFLMRAMNIAYHEPGENDLRKVRAIIDLGFTAAYKNDYQEAKKYYERALKMMDEDAGFYHQLVIETLTDFGRLEKSQNNYEQALDYLYDALRKVDPYMKNGDDAQRAIILTNIASVYYDMKEYSEALRDLKEADKLFELNGKEDWLTAHSDCLNLLGHVNFSKMYYLEAISAFRKAVKISAKKTEQEKLNAKLRNLNDLESKVSRYTESEILGEKIEKMSDTNLKEIKTDSF